MVFVSLLAAAEVEFPRTSLVDGQYIWFGTPLLTSIYQKS